MTEVIEDVLIKCSKCGELKNSECFHKNNRSKNGLQSSCISCRIIQMEEYRRTKIGMISEIFLQQRGHSRERGHNPPEYTKEELIEWMQSQPKFHELFALWEESLYDRELRPSTDRTDDYKGYSFDNITLMTFGENVQKVCRDRISGTNNKQNISVIQMSLEGKHIQEYYSMAHASRELDIQQSSIGACCSGRRNSTGGFKWKYKQGKTI